MEVAADGRQSEFPAGFNMAADQLLSQITDRETSLLGLSGKFLGKLTGQILQNDGAVLVD